MDHAQPKRMVDAQSKELVLLQLLKLLVKQIILELNASGILINADLRNAKISQETHMLPVKRSDPIVQLV